MIAWFRTRKQLHARNTELEALVAKQTEEIAALVTEMNNGWERADGQIKQLQASLSIGSDQVRLTTERDELRQQNIRVHNALQVLRDDIRREEQPAFGMARPVDTAAVHEALRRQRERRMGSQVDAVFGIDEEAAAKRQADGQGDE